MINWWNKYFANYKFRHTVGKIGAGMVQSMNNMVYTA